MMNNDNLMHTNECKCLAWKPIIAGALVAVGLGFLLNLFSVAIGLSAFTVTSEGAEKLVFGGFLGIGIGILASMFAAGWLAGYLGQRHCFKRHLGALYGFLTWCLALIIAVFMAHHVHDYIVYYGHFISGAPDLIDVNNATGNTAATVAEQTKSLVISTYIVFALFFLSAFAASLGGHCGMRHVCKKDGTC